MFRGQQQVIALSNSGNTPEVVQLLPHLRRRKVEVLGMVGVPLTDLPPASVLSQSADLVLHMGLVGCRCKRSYGHTHSATLALHTRHVLLRLCMCLLGTSCWV